LEDEEKRRGRRNERETDGERERERERESRRRRSGRILRYSSVSEQLAWERRGELAICRARFIASYIERDLPGERRSSAERKREREISVRPESPASRFSHSRALPHAPLAPLRAISAEIWRRTL